MDQQIPQKGSLRPIGITVLAIALSGCATSAGSGGPASEDPFAPVKNHILRVAIDADGHAHPDPVPVRKKKEIVVWVAPENTVLEIDFPTENPFPYPVICPGGRFCASLLPPGQEKEEKEYNYTATLQTIAGTTTVDPKLKVVP